MSRIDSMLEGMKALEASDLHLKIGLRPRFRVNGDLQEVAGYDVMTAAFMEDVLGELLTEVQRERFRADNEVDVAYSDVEGTRFRCNIFREYYGVAAVIRMLPARVPTLKELNLPDCLEAFAHLTSGLVMVTGGTGSGKTSTLACLVDVVNRHYRRHIITLEDPIEYVHQPQRSFIHQRSLYRDMKDFSSGIRDSLREDPDVILVGELRDLKTIRRAIAAAETGVLVFATLHTNSCVETIDRIIDVFPAEEQNQVRAMLSYSLAGVVSQVLLRRRGGEGRVPATEVLVGTPAVANLIREGKATELANVIQAGKARGMHTLDDSLERLVQSRTVTAQEAYTFAVNKLRFEQLLQPRA